MSAAGPAGRGGVVVFTDVTGGALLLLLLEHAAAPSNATHVTANAAVRRRGRAIHCRCCVVMIPPVGAVRRASSRAHS
jgi:hypothetical protein